MAVTPAPIPKLRVQFPALAVRIETRSQPSVASGAVHRPSAPCGRDGAHLATAAIVDSPRSEARYVFSARAPQGAAAPRALCASNALDWRLVLECAGTRLRCASTWPGGVQLAAPKPEAEAGAQRRRRFGFWTRSGGDAGFRRGSAPNPKRRGASLPAALQKSARPGTGAGTIPHSVGGLR